MKGGVEVPMSKALNPDYSGGAAQWPTALSVVVPDSFQLDLYLCECHRIPEKERTDCSH